MQSTVTLKVKLGVSKDDAPALDLTRAAYAEALNETSSVAFAQSVSNPLALHHLTYQTIRELTALPANLVCSARAVVAEACVRGRVRRFGYPDPRSTARFSGHGIQSAAGQCRRHRR